MRPRADAAAAAAPAAVPIAPPLLTSWLPISILTDSYKPTHYLQYPPCTKMVAVRRPLLPAACRAVWVLPLMPACLPEPAGRLVFLLLAKV